jgi:peptidoglycan hydrolase CwlO-like protein
MPAAKIRIQVSSYKDVLSAVKKLSAEEKQLLRLQLFASDTLSEMKAFELQLKKAKKQVKKTDDEIAALTNSIRRKNYAHTKKMPH